MAEIEVPIEKIQQDLEHAAVHGGGGHGGGGKNWITWSALLSAILAVLAAVAALEAGHHVNEAMLDQMKASDTWAFYQAKSIKANLAETRMDLMQAMGKEAPDHLGEKIAKYAEEQKDLMEKAKEHEAESHYHFTKHEVFAKSVTFYQIAIAVTAIAVLAGRKKFLLVSIAFGLVGLWFLIGGFTVPHVPPPGH